MLKAAAGGGGRGMRVVRSEAELGPALAAARAEAEAAFGDDTLYLEKYLERPRHIEIQVLGDGKGARHPSRRARLLAAAAASESLGGRPLARAERRRRATRSARPSPNAMREIKYLGVGTVEFLYENGQFYFIEMNTRIQVEHPVTEMITDIDLDPRADPRRRRQRTATHARAT